MSAAPPDYAKMHKDLVRWFRARGVPEHDGADLAQETLLRFARREGEAPERLWAWLAQAARSVFVDHLRRRPKAAPHAELDALASPTAEADLDATVAGWLEPMLTLLEEPDRTILRRSDFEGVPARVVAAELGMSATAVGSRIARARKKLEAHLLACCTFEFDASGRIVGWRRNDSGSCTPGCS